MALTLSTGFVVDDAIVMIENISRYIEMGESPRGGRTFSDWRRSGSPSCRDGSADRRVTLLFMADIVGLSDLQFAVTLAVTIVFSAFVSLTLTPMMAARLRNIIRRPTSG